MLLDPASLASQWPSLKTITGSICPRSLVVSLFTRDKEVEYHEAFHYQQLISTPFGVSLQLQSLDCSLSLAKAIKMLAQSGLRRLYIPLFMYYQDSGPVSDALRNHIAFAFTVRRYDNWVLDKPDFDRSESSSFIGDMMTALLVQLQRVSENMGVRSEVPFFPKAYPKVPAPPYLPQIDGRVFSGRDVLENAATAASILIKGGRILVNGPALLKFLAATKPPSYYRLIQSFERYLRGQLSARFLTGIVALCELSLFGPLLPGMSTEYPKDIDWHDIHPAWRFAKLQGELLRRPKLAEELFSGSVMSVCDRLCDLIGWRRFSKILDEYDPRVYAMTKHPFSAIFTQFSAAMAFRKTRQSVFLSPLLEGFNALEEAIDGLDANERRFRTVIRKRIAMCQIPRRLNKPVTIRKGKASVNRSCGKTWIGFVIANYYLTHFVQRMVFHTDLNYPVELASRERIEEMFAGYFGIAPSQVFRFPT